MGGNASSYSSALPNASARQTFERFLDALQLFPHGNRETHDNLISLRRQIFESLRQSSPDSLEVEIRITGLGNGPVFLQILPSFVVPRTLTSISLRKSGIKSTDLTPLTRFLTNSSSLKELDLSENSLCGGASAILRAALGHPSLLSLQMEDCGIETAALPLIWTIVATTRRLRVLRLGRLSGQGSAFEEITAAVPHNLTLVDFAVAESVDPVARPTLARNLVVSEITANLLHGGVPKSYLTKTKAIKSIKPGARGISGEIPNFGRRMSNAVLEERARFGISETIGRRSEMCGVSIAVKDNPVSGSMLYGVFDGHGGRAAVEYASAHLPAEIATQINAGRGFAEAFEAIHAGMAESCAFSGTTAAVAIVYENRLAVAGVGDTRCVLVHGGVAVQLTVDHRPELAGEAAHILSKGGRVEDGRVNGVLDISRTLGDSVLGECVRATPDVQELDIGERDQYLILACDGVWSVMTNQEAADLIVGEEDPVMAARNIRDKAFELDSRDNISVIVVSLSRRESEREVRAE